MGVHVKSG